MTKDNKPSFEEAIDIALKSLSDSTGKTEDEILALWMPIFKSRDSYVQKLKDISEIKQIELLVNDLEKDISFEVYWIQHALDAVRSWKKAESDVKKAESRLSEVKFLRQMNKLSGTFEKHDISLDYSQKAVKQELRKTDPYSQALTALDYIDGSRIIKTVWRIQKSMLKYKFYHWSRRFLRIGLKVFWGLAVFTIGLGAIVNLVPIWYLSLLIIPAGLWYVQEYHFAPWLDKILLEIQRRYLCGSIHKLHVAQWQASSYLLLESHDLPDNINPLVDSIK